MNCWEALILGFVQGNNMDFGKILFGLTIDIIWTYDRIY